MKKNRLSLLLLTILVVVVPMLVSPVPKNYFYYRNENNYVTFRGTLKEGKYSPEKEEYYLHFVSVSPETPELSGEAYVLVPVSGLEEKAAAQVKNAVRNGGVMRFTAAPRHKVEDSLIPAVELVGADESVLLPRDAGVSHLMSEQREKCSVWSFFSLCSPPPSTEDGSSFLPRGRKKPGRSAICRKRRPIFPKNLTKRLDFFCAVC